MSNISLIIVIVCYLALLFFIAFIAEKNARSKWVNNPYTYTLSLAVYCSAWTYYGSVGVAANSGVGFLPIYLGPVIAFPLWIVVMRKIIRISKQQKVSSLADFISLRYGNSRFLGALITIVCLFATIPYISLQLKALSESYSILTNQTINVKSSIVDDATFYIAVLLAIFAAFYSTQKTDASVKHKGIIVSTAFESILKLVFFLIVGIYVTYFLFDGTEDIYSRIKDHTNFKQLTSIGGFEGAFDWFFTIALSFIAIFLLPRQFQVSVIENTREKHLKKAIWLFPLYLLLFNVFVIFIAWGGLLTFAPSVNSDYYTLLLPFHNGEIFLALMVFLGGFSAVISMVIVSTMALATMVSNNLIIPYGFLDYFIKGKSERNATSIKNIRRIAIFLIIIAAYGFYILFSKQLSLYSIGLISFVIIAQLAPSFFFGLYWNRGSSIGATVGIIVGLIVTAYTLIIPNSILAYGTASSFIENGLLNITSLKPFALFGLDFLSPSSHAFIWSLALNTITFLVISVLFKGNYRERNYAEMFVENKKYTVLDDNALVWKGEAYVEDIKNVLIKFLGTKKTERALNLFFLKYDLPKDTQMADARLINFSEKLLTGSIGNASAKILISGVVKEEEISLIEVLKILEESKENIVQNKVLKVKSDELTELTAQLQKANEDLLLKDKQKDEFLDTVAHELKTPLTGIRASIELLKEDDGEMPEELKRQFLTNVLNDSERLSRLIHNILDFEKLANGRETIQLAEHDFNTTLKKVLNSFASIASEKGINIHLKTTAPLLANYDEDRIIQVITNLITNSIKFCEKDKGQINISYIEEQEHLKFIIDDNGKGVPKEDMDSIFEKFYQSKNQNTIKPIGSGLGLAICKHIIAIHKGEIWLEKQHKNGAMFVFKIPMH
ncbi:MAG: sensor histidine kinase [Flavobacteriales bacterium]|jgi:Na+/proline symporter/nitrogen-specific signal transduction histidine kinase|nr:sensor histidine kinase [Flavobacteriales bacterium]